MATSPLHYFHMIAVGVDAAREPISHGALKRAVQGAARGSGRRFALVDEGEGMRSWQYPGRFDLSLERIERRAGFEWEFCLPTGANDADRAREDIAVVSRLVGALLDELEEEYATRWEVGTSPFYDNLVEDQVEVDLAGEASAQIEEFLLRLYPGQ